MTSTLGEKQITGIAARLVQEKRISERDAQIHCLHYYGAAGEPPMTYWGLSKKFKMARRDISKSLRTTFPLLSEACRIERARMMANLPAVEGYAEDTAPLTFWQTKQFGSNASTGIDMVQKLVVDPYGQERGLAA